MDDFLHSYDLKENFWKVNGHLEAIKEFKDFIKADKSRNKEDSSKIMWAIFLLYHKKSPYTGENIQAKKKYISDDFLLNPSFPWEKDDKIAVVINRFKDRLISPARRFLYEWQEKLEERSKFMASIPYNAETADLLDKMMEKTYKMHEMYKKALESISEEEKEGVREGNAEESLLEKGLI